MLGYERLYAGEKRRAFFDSTVCTYRLGVEENPDQAFRIQGAESFGEDTCSLSPAPQDTVVTSEYVEIFPKTIKQMPGVLQAGQILSHNLRHKRRLWVFGKSVRSYSGGVEVRRNTAVVEPDSCFVSRPGDDTVVFG